MKDIAIKFLAGINMIIITREPTDRFFYSNHTSFAINIQSFSYLISFLVKHGIISPKVLEGILEEYYSNS